MRNPWIVAQLAVAALLLAISLVGIIGTAVFDLPELAFSFAGGIQSFAVFPGLVLSLVVNAVIMRLHREIGINTVEKVLLIIEGVLIALLLLFHFYTDPAGNTFGFAILTWPVVILLATAIAVTAGVRNATRPRTVAQPRGLAGPGAQHDRTVVRDGDRVLEVGAARTVPRPEGPAVGVGVDLVGAEHEPRLDREHQPGTQREAALAPAVVRDVGVAVHDAPDPVPAEVGVHGEPRTVRDVSDRGGDVADLVANHRGGDAGVEGAAPSHPSGSDRPGRRCRRRPRAPSRRPSRRPPRRSRATGGRHPEGCSRRGVRAARRR